MNSAFLFYGASGKVLYLVRIQHNQQPNSSPLHLNLRPRPQRPRQRRPPMTRQPPLPPVADLAAKASWRVKEKSRARKKAKLDNNGGSSSNSLQGGDGSLDGGCGDEGGGMDLTTSVFTVEHTMLVQYSSASKDIPYFT